MAMVSQVDDESALDGLDSDPRPATVLGGLKPTDLVLQQQRYGSRVSVALQPQSEVRLRAFGIEIHHNLLVHVHTGLCYGLLLQPHGF